MMGKRRWIAGAIVATFVMGISATGVRAARNSSAEGSARAQERSVADAQNKSLAGMKSEIEASRRQLAELKGMLVKSQAQSSGTTSGDPEAVTVAGHGRVFGRPDVMTANLGVSAKRPTVGAAMDAAAAAANAMITALKKDGVQSRDIQTASINVSQTWDDQRPTGYVASEDLTVKIRAIDKAGDIVGDAMSAAGNEARMNGVSFDIEENASFLATARKAAMQEAKAKASEYAGYAGRSLGRVISITEVASNMPQPVRGNGSAAPAMAAMPVESGNQEVGVTTVVVYALA